MQVYGIDYKESFSPVASSSSVRMGIALTLYFEDEDWICEVIDIEAAFLEGDIEEPMYIEWPEGMVELGFLTLEEFQETCAELQKGMYGNVDAALRFYKTYSNHLQENVKMKKCRSDQCVLIMKEEEKLVLVSFIHVDDTMLCGKKEAVHNFKTKVKERFNIKELGQLKKHLGIWYTWKKDQGGETYVEATMPELIEEIIKATEEHLGKEVKPYTTPGTPGESLIKHEGQAIDETEYRSIVGKILYLTSKMMIEGCNASRELARYFTGPKEQHWKALYRFVGYLKENKSNIKITYRKPRDLRIVGNVDSDYATNKSDRRSVTGCIMTLGGGTITNWFSQTQRSTTLSSTEAEYCALATGAQDVVFQTMLLEEITGVRKPAIMLEDNTGAIFLVRNQQVGPRTKHIDVRHHFIRELHEDGSLMVKYTESEDNEADMMTKNVAMMLLVKHRENVRNGSMFCYKKWDEIIAKDWREDVKI